MPTITLMKPTDQPTGRFRLLHELKEHLDKCDFESFKIIVAFAKVGPLIRLQEQIKKWNDAGKSIEAIFGIDVKGTSIEALEYALEYFNNVRIVYLKNPSIAVTFHPKIYLFHDSDHAVAYIGSNNLTVGGTETNFETCTKIELDIHTDTDLWNQIYDCWTDTTNIAIELTPELLKTISDHNLLHNETATKGKQKKSRTRTPKPPIEHESLPILKILPPSPLPALKKAKRKTPTKQQKKFEEYAKATTEALVIQIIAHHNGEVFLSKLAVNQNPEFFGWPFKGRTTPKKASNPSYPQREPDPVVQLDLYDKNGTLLLSHENFNLNTVFYESKAEIRITVPQDVVQNTQEYSILVMRKFSEEDTQDYHLEIYNPGSEPYQTYLDICNQQMPSGGKPISRRFGWL